MYTDKYRKYKSKLFSLRQKNKIMTTNDVSDFEPDNEQLSSAPLAAHIVSRMFPQRSSKVEPDSKPQRRSKITVAPTPVPEPEGVLPPKMNFKPLPSQLDAEPHVDTISEPIPITHESYLYGDSKVKATDTLDIDDRREIQKVLENKYLLFNNNKNKF
jgi:hypothetical protein